MHAPRQEQPLAHTCSEIVSSVAVRFDEETPQWIPTTSPLSLNGSSFEHTTPSFVRRCPNTCAPLHMGRGRMRSSTKYRANPKVSRNPNLCVGCFELITSKNSAAASKMGKNAQKLFFFAIFFCGTHFCAACWTKNQFFFCGFFCVLGIGVNSFCCYCKETVRTLHSGIAGIAVHSYTGIAGIAVQRTDKQKKAWFRSTSPAGETLGPRVYSLVPTTNKQFESQKDWQPNIPN